MRDPCMEIAFAVIGATEILPCGQQSFHQEGSFDQIPAVVEHVKNRQRLAGVAIHKMRPRAVISRRIFQESHNLQQAAERLVTSDESALSADDNRHDSESACT